MLCHEWKPLSRQKCSLNTAAPIVIPYWTLWKLHENYRERSQNSTNQATRQWHRAHLTIFIYARDIAHWNHRGTKKTQNSNHIYFLLLPREISHWCWKCARNNKAQHSNHPDSSLYLTWWDNFKYSQESQLAPSWHASHEQVRLPTVPEQTSVSLLQGLLHSQLSITAMRRNEDMWVTMWY